MKKNQIYGTVALALGVLAALFLFVGGDFKLLGETDANAINAFDLFKEIAPGVSFASLSFGFTLVGIGMIAAGVAALALIVYGAVLFFTGDKFLGLNKIFVIVAGALIIVPFIGAVILLIDYEEAKITFQAVMWLVVGALSIASAFVTPKLAK